MTAWSPTFKNGNVTLSNGDLTATSAVATFSAGRGEAASVIGSGVSRYWEVTIDVLTGSDNNAGTGVCNSSETFGDAAYLGEQAAGYGYYEDGNVYFNNGGGGIPLTGMETFAQGDVICWAVTGGGNAWMRVNGGDWLNAAIGSQNPATNTGGINISGLGDVFPAYCVKNGGQITVNFGATAFAFAAPSGFVGFDTPSGGGGDEVDVNPGSIEVSGATLEVAGSIVVDELESFELFPPLGDLGTGDEFVGGGGAEFVLDAHLGKDMLLIIEPWVDAVEGTQDLDMFPPLGALPEAWADSEATTGTEYVAATRGRSTDNDDEPPAQYVPGRLQPLNFGNRLFEGADPLARGGANVGVIRLIDPEGLFDGLINHAWDSTPLIIKRGARNTQFKDWPIVGRFRSAGLIRDMDEKQIQLRDIGWQLEGPLHGETYAGTGDVEGDARLTGTMKPIAFGFCFNVEPVLLSASAQIFQWSLTSSEELIAFRHGGQDFPVNADYPSYAALAAATIPSGECASCLALSLVRPNVTLEFGVRVDVIGDADEVNGHGTPLTRASIIRRIVTNLGTSRLDEDTELDLASFNRMESRHSAPVGWWFGQDITKRVALDIMLTGILGWSSFNPDGQLRIGWVEAPENMTPVVSITGGLDDIGKPRLVATAIPRRGTRISWQWNYGPQPDRAQLALAVSDADAALYKEPAQFATDLAPVLASLYPTAKLVTILEAGFRNEVDASLEASRQQSIFSIVRNRYERDLQVDPLVDLVGSAITINDDPLASPFTQLCVGINASGASSVNTFEFFA